MPIIKEHAWLLKHFFFNFYKVIVSDSEKVLENSIVILKDYDSIKSGRLNIYMYFLLLMNLHENASKGIKKKNKNIKPLEKKNKMGEK